MYIIGLTGGIASGKSTVSKMLAELGAHIIDADEIAHRVILPGQPAWQQVVHCFGNKIVAQDNTIDRKALGQIVFQDGVARKQLEQLTHHYIKDEIYHMLQVARQMKERVVVLDIPLLFEAGWHKEVQEVWVVYVTLKTQVQRLMWRNHLAYEEAMARIQAQMSLEEKAASAHSIIDNNCDLLSTKQQILSLWNNLQNRI